MPSIVQLDACGRRRSPATLSSFHRGRAPRNKGQRYPADPPTIEEIIAVMHATGDDHDAVRLRGLVIVLWRAGLRISEAPALNASDLDLHRGAIPVRHGKGAKRQKVGMDRLAWEQLAPGCMCARRCRSARCSVADRRSRVVAGGCPISAAPRCRPGGCATPVRASSAQTRPCGGDVTRRHAAARHSTPARARRPRDHVGLSAWDRQHRDRPRRPRTPSADDPGHPRPVGPRPLSLVGCSRTTRQAGPLRSACSPTP